MRLAARKPDGHATRMMPATGHLPRGRLGRIVLACGDACVRQGTAWASAGPRALAFVSGLLRLRQHTRRMGPWPEQALVARTPGAVTLIQRHWHWAHAPRLILQLAGSEHTVTTPAATPRPASMNRHERRVEMEAPRFASTLLERMLTRCERINTLEVVERMGPAPERVVSDAGGAIQPAALPAPVSGARGRVPRVLRSESSTPPARTRVKEHPSSHPSSPSPPDSTPHVTMSPRGLPPINIEHLAERVVHAIDRRLTAQRERHGRLGS